MQAISLTDFILEDQKTNLHARGNLTRILNDIAESGKIIGLHLKKAGLVDILGTTGDINTSSDEVKKIDVFSNNLLIKTLTIGEQVATIASEELENPIELGTGDYVVFMDPLDGSANTDANIPVGTIFSIYHKSDSILQPGRKQVAAGYILYGTSDILVYTCGHGVNGFTLDPSIGTFLLSHSDMKIPEDGDIYSVNEANSPQWDDTLIRFIESLKTSGKRARYIGSMVADVHRTLIKGGLFMYPNDNKNTTGKLRLMYEVNPMAFLVEQAGGRVISHETTNPLDAVPSSVHEKSPVILGSKSLVENFIHFEK